MNETQTELVSMNPAQNLMKENFASILSSVVLLGLLLKSQASVLTELVNTLLKDGYMSLKELNDMQMRLEDIIYGEKPENSETRTPDSSTSPTNVGTNSPS
jgi:hypothetical protein